MASGSTSDHEALSSVIKQFHAKLRREAKQGNLRQVIIMYDEHRTAVSTLCNVYLYN